MLIRNDLVEVTDNNHLLFGMLGTICDVLKTGYTVRFAWRRVDMANRNDDKWLLLESQLSKRGHADWRD